METGFVRAGLNRKLYLIYSLNVADWICTVFLLRHGSFYEANPLAAGFIGDISSGFAMKCALPLLIVILIIGVLPSLDQKELHTVDRVISFVVVFYLMIGLLHIVNFLLLFFSFAT